MMGRSRCICSGAFLVVATGLFAVSCKKGTDCNVGRRPNILIAVADDQSYPHAGAYGCDWVRTPAFDRVARDGILMENFYTSNSKSAPSRASLLTGMYSWQLEDIGNHLAIWPEGRFTTVIEALASNGYNAAFTGKGWAPGDPGKVNGEPRRLTGIPYQRHKLKPKTSGIAAVDYASNFKEFMSDVSREDKPWVFWFGSREPHRAYEYGSGVSCGGMSVDMIDEVPAYWPDDEVTRNDILDYSYEISHFDEHLGRMIKTLEEIGELDNTIIIVTADNGMPFPRCKGFGYEHSTHLPFAVMWPDGIASPGRRDSSLLTMVDIAPTLLALAGVEPEDVGMTPEGKDFLDILSDSPRKDRNFLLFGQERHDYGRPENQGFPIRSIQSEGFLYMYNFKPWLWPSCNPETGYLNTDGSPVKTSILKLRREGADTLLWHHSFGKKPQEELYDLEVDPECMNNLADDPAYVDIRESLRAKLFAQLIRQNDPRMGDDGDIFDRYPFNDQSNQDFYERFMSGEIRGYQTGWVNPSDYEPAAFVKSSGPF